MSVQVLGTVIGAIILGILGLIATLVKKTWREKVWGWLARLIKRVRGVGLRLNTAKARKAETDAAVAKALDAFKADVGPRVATQVHGDRRKREASREANLIQFERGRQAGRDEVRAELAAANEFAPSPRWAVTKGPMGKFFIKNSAGDSIARVVRLDAESTLFTFLSGAQWANMDGPRTAVFDGRATGNGAYRGIMFSVTYTDAEGNRLVDDVFLDGWEPGVF